MYCSLDDAWNINNNISNIAKNYETKNETIEKTYNLKKKKIDSEVDSYFNEVLENDSIISSNLNNNKKTLNCEELVNKVLSCEKCRELVRLRLGIRPNNLLNKYLTNDNKEIIILVLIGLIVMILIDLFIKISKSIG